MVSIFINGVGGTQPKIIHYNSSHSATNNASQQLQLTLSLPTGPLGLVIQQNENGYCAVTGRSPAINTPLLENDMIISINGIQLVDVEGGLDSWVKIFSSFSNMPRQVVVRRNAGVDAQDINAGVDAGAPAPTDNGPLVKLSNAWTSNGNYRAGILEAIAELKDRMGSSFQMIRDHMQSNMPPNTEWSNGTYVKTLKKMTADGDLIHINGAGNKGVGGNYKINQDNNKNRVESAQKFEAAKEKEQVEMKKKQEENNRISAVEGRDTLTVDAKTISGNLTLEREQRSVPSLNVANDYGHSSNTLEMEMKLKKIDLFLEKRMALRPRPPLMEANDVGHLLSHDNSQDMEMKLKKIDLFLAKRMASARREIRLKKIEAHKEKAIELKKTNTQESRKIVENKIELQTDLIEEKPQMSLPRVSLSGTGPSAARQQQDSSAASSAALSVDTNSISSGLDEVRRQNLTDFSAYRVQILNVLHQRSGGFGGRGSQPPITKEVEAAMGEEFSYPDLTAALRKMVNAGELVQKKSTYTLSSKLLVKQKEPEPNKKPQMTIQTNNLPPPARLPCVTLSPDADAAPTSKTKVAKRFGGHVNIAQKAAAIAESTHGSSSLPNYACPSVDQNPGTSEPEQSAPSTNNDDPMTSYNENLEKGIRKMKACRDNILAALQEEGGKACVATIITNCNDRYDVIVSTLDWMVGKEEIARSGDMYKLPPAKIPQATPPIKPTTGHQPNEYNDSNTTHCTLLSSNVHTLDMSSVKRTKVTVTINKPSIGSKLGIGIQTIAGGPIEVHYMAPDSVFASSDLTVGLSLESVNGIKYATCDEAVSFMKETVGQMTLVAIREEESTTAL